MILLSIALVAASPSESIGRLALTISGGVSLGNYEAGLTWGFVRYLRVAARGTELAAVTGASAGASNALIAAAMWCEEWAETRDDNPDKNLFHDLWAPVGLDELLPDDPSAFTPADGLLRAAPLERAQSTLRAQLFERGGLRFRPGCAVSLGFTVTRDRPQERRVLGLRAGTQRFVIPWRFQVDQSGHATLVPAPVASDRESADSQLFLGEPSGSSGIGALQASEAMLASGAFPFAFGPRELCDCALSCSDEDVVRNGTCEGPDFGQRITTLSCSSFSPAGSRQLCRRRYVDGGIFDNAPIGLTVDLAEASGARSLPFAPTVYVMVDPDHRRFAPEGPREPRSGLTAPLQLIGNLISTARETELARAIRDERWQRTTQSTLADAAQLLAEMSAVQEEMARVAGASGGAPQTADRELLRSPRRLALAPFLSGCVRKLRLALRRPDDLAAEEFADCAEAIRDGSAGSNEPRAARPSPAYIVELARTLAAVFVSSSTRSEETLEELTASGTPFDRQLRLLVRVHDVSTIATTSFRFLVGEVPGAAESGLNETELVQLRRDLLVLAGAGARFLPATSAMLRVLVSVSLLEEQQEGTLPSAAAAARAAVDAGLDPNLEGAPLHAMASASDRIARLIALAPRLRALTARAAAIAASAALLSAKDTAERQLVLSRRFSPLAGGQLFNFSGFLDRPLRDLDFYIGVYDALQQIAVRNCQVQGPYVLAERPAPVFRADAPLELDLAAPDSQRCLGQALSAAFGEMQLSRSSRATFVVSRLARLEVTASVGSSEAAARILAEPSWSWLGDPQLPAGDQLGPALAAVTSRKAPCKNGDAESLCLADPSFDELLDGLQHSRYVPKSSEMRAALSDRDRWTASLAGRLVDRAAAVESSAVERTRGPVSGTFLTGVGLGQLWARRANSLSGPGLDLDPSSIPSRSPAGARPGFLVAAHIVPYRVSLDVVRGGIALSWVEPSLRLFPSFSIDSVADLLAVEGSGRVATTLGLIPTLRARGAAFGAGAQVAIPWNGDSVALPGIVGRVAWLQERLALTGGVRSLTSGQREAFVTLSVSDINGLAYWLALWALDWK